MSLRFVNFSVSAFLTFLVVAPAVLAQDPPASQPPSSDAPQTAVAPPATKSSAGPDYPDPRTFTAGIFYWVTIPGSGPDLRGGKLSTDFATVNGLGGAHRTPGVELSMPVTRTGVVHLEAFIAKGDGTQIAPVDTNPFSTFFAKGTYLANQYQITAAKLYLDDLLYPFKFPVARFRVKSLWEVQYITIKSTVDGPLVGLTQDSSGNVLSTTGTGSRSIIFPTIGLAAEYDLAPHLMFRAAASGFGLPHRAEIWDAEAFISYRRKSFEWVGGYKVLHFKTTPQRDEYLTDTLQGGFIGLRWHF